MLIMGYLWAIAQSRVCDKEFTYLSLNQFALGRFINR